MPAKKSSTRQKPQTLNIEWKLVEDKPSGQFRGVLKTKTPVGASIFRGNLCADKEQAFDQTFGSRVLEDWMRDRMREVLNGNTT